MAHRMTKDDCDCEQMTLFKPPDSEMDIEEFLDTVRKIRGMDAGPPAVIGGWKELLTPDMLKTIVSLVLLLMSRGFSTVDEISRELTRQLR